MFSKKHLALKRGLIAIEWAFVTFISVVGVIGMILMYAPDDVIHSLYWAGFCCAVAVGLIKYIGSMFKK